MCWFGMCFASANFVWICLLVISFGKAYLQTLNPFFLRILRCWGYAISSSAVTASSKPLVKSSSGLFWCCSNGVWYQGSVSVLLKVVDLLIASCNTATSHCTSSHPVPRSGVKLRDVWQLLGWGFFFNFPVLTEQICSSLRRCQLWIWLTSYLGPKRKKSGIFRVVIETVFLKKTFWTQKSELLVMINFQSSCWEYTSVFLACDWQLLVCSSFACFFSFLLWHLERHRE